MRQWMRHSKSQNSQNELVKGTSVLPFIIWGWHTYPFPLAEHVLVHSELSGKMSSYKCLSYTSLLLTLKLGEAPKQFTLSPESTMKAREVSGRIAIQNGRNTSAHKTGKQRTKCLTYSCLRYEASELVARSACIHILRYTFPLDTLKTPGKEM